MSRFDRYMLSQLMVLFGFFSLVLVLVYWVNQAVRLFDRLIGDGQSALIFLEFTALTLPNVIRLVLPVSTFAAAVYVTNRMSTESELVVAQSTGMSPFRLARGVLGFGLIVALLMSMLVHVLVPASRTMMARRQAALDTNISARFLSEGQFLHPADGLTLFIRHITTTGELHGLFLSNIRTKGRRTTYTAQRALLINAAAGTKLVMFDGMAQTLELADRHLFTTSFKDFTFDIGALIGSADVRQRAVAESSTWNLLTQTDAVMAKTGAARAQILYEAHSRMAEPLTALAAALLGFATLLTAGFSRFGARRQVMAAIVLLIVMQLLVNAATNLAEKNAALWVLAYVPALYGFLATAVLLWWSARPRGRSAGRTATPAEDAA